MALIVEALPGVYRSPLPRAMDVRAFALLGGRTVIDLTRRPRGIVERACARHGVTYIKHGLPYDFTLAMVEAAAVLVVAQPMPVLVHCFHGRGRTGAVIQRLGDLARERAC